MPTLPTCVGNADELEQIVAGAFAALEAATHLSSIEKAKICGRIEAMACEAGSLYMTRCEAEDEAAWEATCRRLGISYP